MSRKVLVDLLRGELGFTGLVVTDGIEMAAIADTFGIAEGTVLALAAGVDAVCVGGGLRDEGDYLMLRDALVDAVRDGRLPAERLHDAATRVRELGAWAATQRAAVEGKHAAGGESETGRGRPGRGAARGDGLRGAAGPADRSGLGPGVRADGQQRGRDRGALGPEPGAVRTACREHGRAIRGARHADQLRRRRRHRRGVGRRPAAAGRAALYPRGGFRGCGRRRRAGRWCWWCATRTGTPGWPRRWPP